MKTDLGIIGLGQMGSNLAYNVADQGYKISVIDKSLEVTDHIVSKCTTKNLFAHYDYKAFIESLKKPAIILIMIRAGSAIDQLIDHLLPYLNKDDVIADLGNSYYKDSMRRYYYLKDHGIAFLDIGVSGGIEGARNGPSIMVGGDEASYEHVKPILEKISAKYEDQPCCKYFSGSGSGHYIKMVHNGIEYAVMQSIAELVYLTEYLWNDRSKTSNLLHELNSGPANSYLLEITEKILTKRYIEDGTYVIDSILDVSEQNGTGKWSILESIRLGVDTSIMSAALNARFISSFKSERIRAQKLFPKNNINNLDFSKEELSVHLQNAFYAVQILIYSQGFALLKCAEGDKGWLIDYSEVASVFRNGCIIRAGILDVIKRIWNEENELKNMLLSSRFSSQLLFIMKDLRAITSLCINISIPAPIFTSAVSYFDSYTTANSSANIVQAQRDYFGGHGFKTYHSSEKVHHDWENKWSLE